MLIAQYINHFAEKSPAAPAMIHNGRPISYNAFAQAISRTGTEISSYGVQSPGTAAVKIRNLADCWVTTLALQAKGYTTICISSLESLQSLQVKDLAALFVSVEENNDPMPGSHGSAPIFELNKPGFEEIAPSQNAATAGHNNECGHSLYTSGTTGNYKKCLLTARTQQPRDRQRCEYYHWDRNTRFHGLSFGLWTSIGYNLPPSVWSVGGCVLLDQQDDWPSRFFDSDPSFVFLLPDQALQLCEMVNPRFLKAEKSPKSGLACRWWFSLQPRRWEVA